MKRVYETVIICDPDVNKDVILEEFSCVFAKSDMHEVYYDDLGVKKLAYEIRGRNEGQYFLFTYEAEKDARIIHDIELLCRITDSIVKFITLARDEDTLDEMNLSEKFRLTIATPDKKPYTQSQSKKIDAYDVMLGLANYERRKE